MQKIYFHITTPPYSATGDPDLGHAYSALAADILARHKRARQIPVFFQAGGGEHGAGVEKAAAKKNLTAEAWCGIISDEFTNLWKILNISCDRFTRTSDPGHQKVVQAAFQKLISTGDIYPGKRESLYCRSCARFYRDRELKDGNCPAHAVPAEKISEDVYFFRLSKYRSPLLAHYTGNPAFLAPGRLAREAANFISSGLKDVPVSRTNTAWGIKTLSNPEHTVSAWFDTLLSYTSGPGYAPDAPSDSFQMKWPPDVHLAGKESLHFHAVLWPALLMALGLELPKIIHAHGRWAAARADGTETLKPEEIVREYGSDALRYFLFREIRFGADGKFSLEALKRRYNTELADGLGNLFSRVLGMVQKYLSGSLPGRPENGKLFDELSSRGPEIDSKIDAMKFPDALSDIRRAIAFLNKAIEEKKPWALADAEPERLKAFLHDLVWSLRAIAGWIYPFMPDTATRMQLDLAAAKTSDAGFETQKAAALFPKRG